MSPARRRLIAGVVIAALAGAGAGLVLGIAGDEDGPAPSAPSDAARPPAPEPPPVAQPAESRSDEPRLPGTEKDPSGLVPGPSGPPPESVDQRRAAAAARDYVAALDARNGAAVCRSFAPGALERFEFPRTRGSCPVTVQASLGHAERGRPVWESSQTTPAVSVDVSGDTARVVMTVFTIYADVREPTIEDDIVHLERTGREWLVAKPSATMYRAIGIADVPISALAPP